VNPMATARHSNNGLRKICNCSRRQWAKCPHVRVDLVGADGIEPSPPRI